METFNFGENLRRIRKPTGISQEAMALKLNMTQSMYSRIERGKCLPDDKFIAEAAAFLGVPISDLKPPGWDQVKKIVFACSLTYSGKIAYRMLIAAAAFDMSRGFWDGAEIVSDLSKTAVASFFGMVAIIFLHYTEYSVDDD